MARQFFVGGNFKMNPVTKEQAKALANGLNDAVLDPSTGNTLYPLSVAICINRWPQRGRHRSSFPLPSPFEGHPEPRNQAFCPERVSQNIRRVHWGDQVRPSLSCPTRCSQ